MAFFVQLAGRSVETVLYGSKQVVGSKGQRPSDHEGGINVELFCLYFLYVSFGARIVTQPALQPAMSQSWEKYPILIAMILRQEHSPRFAAISSKGKLCKPVHRNLNSGNIGTIHGSLFSNNQLNQIHHHHHHHPQADDDADYAEIKVQDIILETELRSSDIHHDLQSDGTLVEVGRIWKYTGRLFQQPHGSMLIHKYEGLASTDWKRVFNVFSAVRSILPLPIIGWALIHARHPNIIQLYGLCRSSNFTALIFHNAQRTQFLKYHLSLSGPSFITYIADAETNK
ncbi:hypothetical protein C8J56DRAFT_1084408 [Mycena floridula]|nr:hypothetical protein C8J56DRAFT_1084408 [Mycena floridula]